MWPLQSRDVAYALGVEPPPAGASFTGLAIGSARFEPADLFVALDVGARDGHAHVDAYLDAGGGLAIVDAGWPGPRDPAHAPRCLRVHDVMAAYRALAELARSRFTFPVIAIAGANGKTTTKDMLRAILAGGGHEVTATEGTENGHYGVPLTLLDRRNTATTSALVVEIGIDEAGTMRQHAALARPDVAILTSLGAEHLAGLGDEDTAAREELALFDATPRPRRVLDATDPRLRARLAEQRAGDVTVLGAGDAITSAPGVVVLETVIADFDGAGRELVVRGEGHEVRLRVPMPGIHHARLAALAAGAAIALGRTAREIEEGFASFEPPPGRARVVPLDRGVVLVDDTFNASPGSMRAAIALAHEACWADRPKALFLGDMLDLGAASAAAHLALVSPLRELAGAHVRLFGDEMKPVAEALASSSHELASVAHAPSSADPTTLLDGVWASLEGAVAIVKGSRGMRLERIAGALARAYGRPRPLPARPAFASDFFTLGVTGTNGKTSTTTFAAAMLARARGAVVRATTLGYFVGDGRLDHALDFPLDFDGFVAALAEAHARGARTAALEVTSEALQHGFAKVWPFHVGVFTNLTHDHLDVHTTPEHYLASKAQLFMNLAPGGTAVLDACDPACALLREIVPEGVSILTYGVATRGEPDGDVDLFVRDFRPGERVVLERSARMRDFPERLALRAPSSVFVENALAAALGAFASGVAPSDIVAVLAEAAPPRGRFEQVADGPRVFVDYAHTPDALARTIAAARALGGGRVLVVFGAGGDRDTRKREPMGRAASAADVVFLTSDNPRTEDPAAIAADLARGLAGHANVVVELDRARAIALAIDEAREDDIVLVCGKGHETDQIIGTTRHPFSDHDVVRRHHRAR